MGVEESGPHFREVESHPVESVLFRASPGCSGILGLGFSGTIQFNLGFTAPGVYHLLWSPDPDEGSPTGCLWWSPMGGEVTYMHHILRGGCEP